MAGSDSEKSAYFEGWFSFGRLRNTRTRPEDLAPEAGGFADAAVADGGIDTGFGAGLADRTVGAIVSCVGASDSTFSRNPTSGSRPVGPVRSMRLPTARIVGEPMVAARA